jgi:shikimate kinase
VTSELPRCIALLGFRGAGKSTLGSRLALELARPFFDLDAEIEQAQGRSVAAIFREDGEAAFRRVESETLEGVVVRPGIVLATGGGIVEAAGNRKLLRERAFSIFLDVPAPALARRLAAGALRPRLTDLDLEEEVEMVLARRRPLYSECADRVLGIGLEESVAATFSRWRALL